MIPCDQALRLLAHQAEDASAREHLAQCPICASVVEGTARLMHPQTVMPMAPALRAALQDLQPVRPFSVGRRAVAPLVVALLLLASAWFGNHRPDIHTLGELPMAFTALTHVLVGMGALLLVLARGPRGVGLPRSVMMVALAAALVWFEVGSSTTVDWEQAPAGVAWWLSGLKCLLTGLVYGALTGVTVVWGTRQAAPVAPNLAGALAGAAAAFSGVMVLHLKCGIQEPVHVLGFHALVLVVAAGAGALLGPRWLNP